jgi:hypothetical protein
MRRALFAVALLALTGQGQAQGAGPDRPVGFQSPSGNIFCQFFAASAEAPATLRCDIMAAQVSAKRPRDCELEFGKAFEITSRRGRPGERICYGDTIADRTLPTLGYGAAWQRDGFTCSAEPSGLTCFNADRHGFTLSRTSQDVF